MREPQDQEANLPEVHDREECLPETREVFNAGLTKDEGPGSSAQIVRPRFVSIEELQIQEYIAACIALAILMLVSSVPLALGTPPESPIPLHIKAPWIFGGIQWLLWRFPVAIAGWIIPAASLGFLLTLPWWAGKAGIRWGRLGFMVLALFWSIITLAYFFES